MKIDFDFFQYYDNVPIDEVASILGMERDRHGKYLCPCHDDTNPSMIITTKHGKYENRFKCFSCGESGNPIDLVMAVKHNITPSMYYANYSKYRSQLIESLLFLDEHYPGGVTEKDEYHNENTVQPLPKLPPQLMRDIGLQPSLLHANARVRMQPIPFASDPLLQQYNQMVEEMNGTVFDIRIEDKLTMILQKLDDYATRLLEYRQQVFQDFPDLPAEAKTYISQTLQAKIEEVSEYIRTINDYMIAQYPDFNIEEADIDISDYL